MTPALFRWLETRLPLTRPAMISAFLCPGLGQWLAGRRLLGAALMLGAVASVGTPFAVCLLAMLRPPPCDLWSRTLWQCNLDALAHAWRATVPVLRWSVPSLAAIWAGAVAHAQRLGR